jgi:hypothetical protein
MKCRTAFSDSGWSELITCSAENLLGATALVNASLDRMTDSSPKSREARNAAEAQIRFGNLLQIKPHPVPPVTVDESVLRLTC